MDVVTEIVNSRKLEHYDQLTMKLSKNQFQDILVFFRAFDNGKKIPLAPPLLVNNCLTSDFRAKVDLF